MFYLDNNSGVPVMPAVKEQFSNNPLFFTEGGNGVAPSWPGADWFNIVQSELLNVLIEAGIVPEKSNHTQLATAIRALFSTVDGDEFLGVKQPYPGALLRTQHFKNSEILTPGDFENNELLIKAAILAEEKASVFNSSFTFTLTVGVSGDYTTLSKAIEGAQRMRPLWRTGNDYCVIKLKAGFVLNEQMKFGAGVDLSWIKIIAEDTVVFSSTTTFTQLVRTYYEHKYLFYFYDGAKSPVFSLQIEENRNDSDVTCFLATQNAVINLGSYSGGRKFLVGADVTYGAFLNGFHTGCAPDAASVAAYKPAGYYLADFSRCRKNAVMAISAYVNLPLSLCEYVTEMSQPSVTAIYNTVANFQGTSVSYSYLGWNIRDGAHVNIRDHKSIHCTYRGLSCIHTAYVDARRHDTEETDFATSGKVKEPTQQNGFYGCTLGVRADGAACIDVAGNDMRNCGTAVNADTGAVISGKAVDISGSTLGFDCHAGSTVPFPRLWGKDVQKLMHLQDGVKFSSNVCHVTGTHPTLDIRWIDVERSDAVFMNYEIDADSGIIADCGSRITMEGSTETPGTTKIQSIRSFFGSFVAINNSKADRTYADTANVGQLIISGGAFISATGYTNANGTPMRLSTARNVLSIAGAIFSVDGATA